MTDVRSLLLDYGNGVVFVKSVRACSNVLETQRHGVESLTERRPIRKPISEFLANFTTGCAVVLRNCLLDGVAASDQS